MRSLFYRRIPWVVILCTVVAMAPAGSAVSAQGACTLSRLSAADCALIATAGDNLAGIKTFVLDYTVNFRATGLTSGNISFSSQGTGPVDVSNASGTTLSEILSTIAAGSKLNFTMAAGSRRSSDTLELRLVDGTVYVNGSQTTKKQWEKFSASAGLDTLLGSLSQTPIMRGASLDLLGYLQKTGLAAIPDAYQATSQPGRTVDGQATTQISLTIALYPFLAYLVAPEHRAQFKTLIQGAGLTSDEIDGLASALPMFRTTLQDTKFQQSWLIGRKDKLYHGYSLSFAMRIDPTLSALFMGDSNGTAQAVTVSLTLRTTLSQIGKPAPVQVVDNATDITDQIAQGFPPSVDQSSASGGSGGQQAFIPKQATSRYKDLKTGISTEGFATLGNPKAPVRIVQISSYACNPCREYYTTIIIPVLDEIQTGRVYYTFIPVSVTGEFNPAPENAAAYCALQQDKFWQMHDVLFDWQVRYGKNATDSDRLIAGAKALDMDVAKFSDCLTGPDAQEFVQKANDLFDRLKLQGTPSVFINGKLFHPAADGQAEPDLRGYIDELAANGGQGGGGNGLPPIPDSPDTEAA